MPLAPQLLLSGCIALATLVAFPHADVGAGPPITSAPPPLYPISARLPDPALAHHASSGPASVRVAVLRTPCAAPRQTETAVAEPASGVQYRPVGRSDSLLEIACLHGQSDRGRPLRPVFF